MEINARKKAHDHVLAEIDALDLAPIKFKLMNKEEGHGWSREYADHMEIEYKRFLILLAKYPEASIAPSKEVDKFWHGHILDTLKYAEDCHRVFGYFLHHFPYFGMRGSEDAANLAAAADEMNRLYRKEFGDAQAAQSSAYCGVASAVSYCGAMGAVSYCGATAAASYCGAASEMNYSGAIGAVSYCGATGAASYCGVTNVGNAREAASSTSILNTAARPTLPQFPAK